VWQFVDDGDRGSMICLIMRIVLLVASAFQYRILGRTRTFPLLLLRLLDAPAHVEDATRMEIAKMWLDASSEELSCKGTDDMAEKFRDFYMPEITLMRDKGSVPMKLYGALLIWRSVLPLDNQELEGMASMIQVMCKIAPNSRRALISDRTCIKKGDRISAAACEGMDALVRSDMENDSHVHRFLPVALLDQVPCRPAYRPPIAEYHSLVAGYAYGCYGIMEIGPKLVYTFDSAVHGVRHGFICTWSYFSSLFVARCELRKSDSDPNCVMASLMRPLLISTLRDFLVEMVQMRRIDEERLAKKKLPGQRSAKQQPLQLYFAKCMWSGIGEGSCDLGDENVVECVPRVPKKKAAGPEAAAAGSAAAGVEPIADDGDDGEEAEEPDLLEAELAEIMAAECPEFFGDADAEAPHGDDGFGLGATPSSSKPTTPMATRPQSQWLRRRRIYMRK